MNKGAEVALTQAENKYALRYQHDHQIREVYVVGINFTSKTWNIERAIVKQVKKDLQKEGEELIFTEWRPEQPTTE